MHRSRLAGIVIDCKVEDLDRAAEFWGRALGRKVKPSSPPSPKYRDLEGPADEILTLVQKVDHPSRVHLDIESTDIEAEVVRLEKLGAKRLEKIETWWVMEAPTGQRFCVVRKQKDDLEHAGNVWDDGGKAR